MDRAADAPNVGDVLELAHRSGCSALLLDTFVKDGRNLFDHLAPRDVGELVRAVRERKMHVVLAGALQATSLQTAVRLDPDYVAVRGAVCREGRTSAVDASLVQCVAALVRRCSIAFPPPMQRFA